MFRFLILSAVTVAWVTSLSCGTSDTTQSTSSPEPSDDRAGAETGSSYSDSTIVMGEPAQSPDELQGFIDRAVTLIQEGQCELAVAEFLNPVRDWYEAEYADSEQRVYCTANSSEALLYMMKAATDGESAIALNMDWSDSYYFKAYCAVELGNLEEAKASLRLAIELAPFSPQYLCEMGHVYQLERDWEQSNGWYEQALSTATTPMWKTRALRGIGYNSVELGDWDAAENAYAQALEIDPNDQKSQVELDWVRANRS